MACELCSNIPDIREADGPYLSRTCTGCGRKINFRRLNKDGSGITVQEGETFTIPAAWLTIAANPLKGNGHLARPGLRWFADLVFIKDGAITADALVSDLGQLDRWMLERLGNYEPLKGYDLETEAGGEAAIALLNKDPGDAPALLLTANFFLGVAAEALKEGDAIRAAHAAIYMERYRALHAFKEHFEEVVWMGHSAKRLVDLLRLWDSNKSNDSEEFWQTKFKENAFALSQLFSVPITLIQDKAYLGGQTLDRGDARVVDFLLTGGDGSEAILLEIKTPTTPLMKKSHYRKNVITPSTDLVGSVIQAVDYRATLVQNMLNINAGGEHDLSAFNPRAVVVVGNYAELDTPKKRRSFELYRANLSRVDVVTFDELFRKLENLAELFGLTRK